MKKLIVFDGNSILNRAFYGVRPLQTGDGFPTNALFGLISILRKNFTDDGGVPFTHAAIAFDMHAPTFRHKLSSSYKAHRKGMPDDLAKQLPLSKDISAAFGITVLEKEGYEADDILGTLCRVAAENGAECVVVTGDRDSFQLVSENITVRLAATNETKIINDAAIREMYGLDPAQLIDLKSIMGDSSDNIKGVAGIGEKGALALLHEYESLDGVYANIDKIKQSLAAKLVPGKKDAYLSYELAKINKHVPVSETLSDYGLKARDDKALLELFTKLEFSNFIKSFDIKNPENAPKTPEKEDITPEDLLSLPQKELFAQITETEIEVFDGSRLLGCPLNETSAALFNEGRKITFWSVKESARLLFDKGYGFRCDADDVSLMAYLVSQTENGLSPEKAALVFLGYETFSSLSAVLPPLKEILTEKLKETSGLSLYRDIELPLAVLLAKMEHTGFYVDADGLFAYGKALEREMREIETAVYGLAGEEFNLNSPKKLSVILFEKLKLPTFRKTKSGFSTNVEVLEKLLPYHPIIDLILSYRKTAKLKSTYCDGLFAAVSPDDGRVHTTFRQTLTKTGRLSSVEPNLQNIPVRTAEGQKLRQFFAAKEGYILIDADYSQIELRILAHIAGDEAMKNAFQEGKDIHASTAVRVFGVKEEAVTPEMRKRAKAVNFGIIYGIGDYSLSEDLGITKKEAGDYIKSYLGSFPGVKAYFEEVKRKAREEGFVTTLYGRRRYVPELGVANKSVVAFGERVAMNTPIQGTAADIIKKAMVDADRLFEEKGLDAKLILQVHDELIVEAAAKDAEKAKETLVFAMENAARLNVPLTADVSSGKTWYDAKGN